MADQVIILVTDRGDPKHGEITVLEDASKAARLVETLLEAGFEQERIRVFHGGDVPMKVSYRPVVELPAAGDRPSAREGEPSEDSEDDETPLVQTVRGQSSDAPVVAASQMRASPMLSSQFRPTGLRAPQAGLRGMGIDVVS